MVVEGDNNVDNEDLTLWSEKAGAPAGHGWKIKNKSTDVSLETLSHAASKHCYNGRTDECIHLKMDGAVKYGVTKPTKLNEGMYINVSSFISIVQMCITLIPQTFRLF